MGKSKPPLLHYPPNLHLLDLATMVTMYRSRGEPRRASPGKFLACSHSLELIREGKWWFGLYYSQRSWDELITRNSGGYPMTHAEFIALGKIKSTADPCYREFLEVQIGVSPKLGYLILNDLRQFGFLDEDAQGVLSLTPSGDKALDGVSRRLFGKRFSPDQLQETEVARESATGEKSSGGTVTNQVSLF